MRAVVKEDRRGFGRDESDQELLRAAQEENQVVHSTCAGNFLLIYICNFHVLNHFLLIYVCKLHWNPAILWQRGLAAEALALVEHRRDAPSKQLIDLWRYGQRMRGFFTEGDLRNAKEQATASAGSGKEGSLDNEASCLYPGAGPEAKSMVCRLTTQQKKLSQCNPNNVIKKKNNQVLQNCLLRARAILITSSVTSTSASRQATSKLWRNAATLTCNENSIDLADVSWSFQTTTIHKFLRSIYSHHQSIRWRRVLLPRNGFAKLLRRGRR